MTESTVDPEPEATEKQEPEPMLAGRPIEDRSFELVEVAAGAATGLVIGTAVAGPVGTVVGGFVGAAAGLVAGEALERHEGLAATTTDAASHDRPE